MRINYFSDIHLEFGPLAMPDNDAELIVAAGDIGVFKQGLAWLKTLDKPVIYVAGNHEFYNSEYTEVMSALKDECIGSNVCFLENGIFEYKNIRFLGCSLWTDLFIDGTATANALGESINDFKRIKYNENAFNIYDFSRLHCASKKWLEEALAEPYRGKTIVVTHHAPTEWSWNKSSLALKKLAYCNDLKYLFHEYEIEAWFHGHVHSLGDYRIAGTRILSNPRGYVGKKVVEGFNPNLVVDI